MNPQTLLYPATLDFLFHNLRAWVAVFSVVAVGALYVWYKWSQLSKALDEVFEWELGPDRDSKGKNNFGPASAETETQSLSHDPVGNERVSR